MLRISYSKKIPCWHPLLVVMAMLFSGSQLEGHCKPKTAYLHRFPIRSFDRPTATRSQPKYCSQCVNLTCPVAFADNV